MNSLEAFFRRSVPDPSAPDEPDRPEDLQRPAPGPSAARREPDPGSPVTPPSADTRR